MRRTFTTMAAAAAVWALATLPAAGQSTGSGSAGSGSTQQGGSSSGSGATDQKGSTHGDQTGSGTGQSGTGQTGASGQSGTGQSGTGSGQSGTSQGATAKGSSQDRTFIMEAAAGGAAEVELGRLATQKGVRSEVKEFGQMMVDDHRDANDQLMKIAQDKGLAPPHALKPQDKETQERLSKLSGEAFDRAYMQHMVKDHQKDVALFRKHSTSASAPDVKQFASSTLPTLERHLRRAQEIEQLVGGSSGTPRGTSGTSPGAGASDRDKDDKGRSGSKEAGSGSQTGTSGSGSGTSGGGTTPPE